MIYDESKYDRVYSSPQVQELYDMGRGYQTFREIPVYCELGRHEIPNGGIVYRDRTGLRMICRSCMDDADYTLRGKQEVLL